MLAVLRGFELFWLFMRPTQQWENCIILDIAQCQFCFYQQRIEIHSIHSKCAVYDASLYQIAFHIIDYSERLAGHIPQFPWMIQKLQSYSVANRLQLIQLITILGYTRYLKDKNSTGNKITNKQTCE